jgi:hypothetical protein
MRNLLTVVVLAVLASSPAPRNQNALPLEVQESLTVRYPGWHFARLASHLVDGVAPGQSPAWVAADFDGDGRKDYAIQLVAPSAPRDSLQQVVALLARSEHWQLLVIQAAGLNEAKYLGREPKGGILVDLQRWDDRYESDIANGAVRLENDGLTIYHGQEAASTCFYRSPRFTCVVSGD